jgi:hypothetical protein
MMQRNVEQAAEDDADSPVLRSRILDWFRSYLLQHRQQFFFELLR